MHDFVYCRMQEQRMCEMKYWHFYEIILNLDQWFSWRCRLKIFLLKLWRPFCNVNRRVFTIWYKALSETFLRNYIEFGPVAIKEEVSLF